MLRLLRRLEKCLIILLTLPIGTGVGVYLDGILMVYMPTQKATEPQDYGGVGNIWGTDYLSCSNCKQQTFKGFG